MKNPSKSKQKLSLAKQSIRTLTDLRVATGGQVQEPWGTISSKCTKDLFCPTASGMCP